MSTLCEPVVLGPGSVARYERVRLRPSDAPNARLRHFHACGEVVLFERVSGSFICDGLQAPITDGTMVYVPPMACHDFAIDPGTRAWRIVQFDPDAGRAIGAPLPSTPMVGIPDGATLDRLSMLIDWQGDPTAPHEGRSARLAALLWDLSALPLRTATPAAPSPIDAFRPALSRLHQAPGARLCLGAAAALCGLSPTHFSRKFASAFGQGYADYVIALRLNVASRRLVETLHPMSTIAYDLGFASPSHFAARFRERFGATPSAFRAASTSRGLT